jgi:hypothetical protein
MQCKQCKTQYKLQNYSQGCFLENKFSSSFIQKSPAEPDCVFGDVGLIGTNHFPISYT